MHLQRLPAWIFLRLANASANIPFDYFENFASWPLSSLNSAVINDQVLITRQYALILPIIVADT